MSKEIAFKEFFPFFGGWLRNLSHIQQKNEAEIFLKNTIDPYCNATCAWLESNKGNLLSIELRKRISYIKKIIPNWSNKKLRNKYQKEAKILGWIIESVGKKIEGGINPDHKYLIDEIHFAGTTINKKQNHTDNDDWLEKREKGLSIDKARKLWQTAIQLNSFTRKQLQDRADMTECPTKLFLKSAENQGKLTSSREERLNEQERLHYKVV